MTKNNRCVVLGANGFIGSHIVDRLVGEGYRVVAFDRFSNEPKFNPSDQIEVVKGDIFNIDKLSTCINSDDYVFHCYSATTPSSADNDPYIDITDNLLNNVKIIEVCVKNRIKKFVYISSGGTVYGEGGMREDDVALPVSPYGISKLATERYLAYFKIKYGLVYIVYRLSNPYGPRQVTKHNQGAIPRFMHQISAGEPITMYGDGTSTRDYIFIEDASRLIAHTFSQDANHEIYNLGSGKQTSLMDIVSTLETVCGVKAKILHIPEPPTFIKTASLDTSRIEQEFNVKANTEFLSGVAKTWEYSHSLVTI